MNRNKHIDNRIDKGNSNDILNTTSLKNNPFTVPDEYFSRMEEQLHARIHNTAEKKNPVPPALRTAFAMAAMFALVFGLGYSILYITGTHNGPLKQTIVPDNTASIEDRTDIPKESLSDEELLQYYGAYYTYPAETLETIDIVPPPVNKEEIEQYLIESNVPSFTILAALE